MYFDFNEKSSFLLFFMLHGVVFGVLLLLKGMQNQDKPSLWLSLFTFLSSLYIAPFVFGYAGWYTATGYREVLFYIPFQQLFLLPPVLYFYCKTLLDRSFVFSKKDYLHFLPATLYFLYSALVFVTDTVILNDIYFYRDGRDKDFSLWYQIVGFFMLLIYLLKSLQTYNRYKRITYDTLSFADAFLFTWAKRFLVAFLLLLSIRLLFFIINPEWGEFGKKFWYYCSFSVLFYYVSISGFVNSIRSLTFFNEYTAPLVDDESNSITNPVLPQNEPVKAELQDLAIWKQKIEELMLQEKRYINPELTITDVSNELGTHSKKISQVINQGFNMNFNDFVNHYRTKAVIEKMEKGEHTMMTLLALALDCGFNSKSTFNRAFKRYTGSNPKTYIEKNGTQLGVKS